MSVNRSVESNQQHFAGRRYFVFYQDTLQMSTVQKPNAGARFKALLILALGAVVGVLLIIRFERYRVPFLGWLISEPEKLSYRLGLFSIIASVLGSAPMFGLSIYLSVVSWRQGDA
jgi:hypothetical protein